MSYADSIKRQAIRLRRNGESLVTIARKLGIAKSTASLWLVNVLLPNAAARKIQKTIQNGRAKGLALMQVRRKTEQDARLKEASKFINTHRLYANKTYLRLIGALLFWCEGSHSNTQEVRFTNSDPHLVSVFLHAIRSSFPLEERKFRALIHIHEYHDDLKQKHFWSKITKIPLDRFTKSYIKPHTGLRKRENYPGCISIRYGSASIAKMLAALYHSFAYQVVKGA